MHQEIILMEYPIVVIVCDTTLVYTAVVEHWLMVLWVIRLIPYMVDPLSYFLFQPVLHDWNKRGHDMCFQNCGIPCANENE